MDEWDIKLTTQTANSPEMNINDLSFFQALQSAQWDSVEEANHDMDGLVEAVRTAVYESFEPMKLNCSFLLYREFLRRRLTGRETMIMTFRILWGKQH